MATAAALMLGPKANRSLNWDDRFIFSLNHVLKFPPFLCWSADCCFTLFLSLWETNTKLFLVFVFSIFRKTLVARLFRIRACSHHCPCTEQDFSGVHKFYFDKIIIIIIVFQKWHYAFIVKNLSKIRQRIQKKQQNWGTNIQHQFGLFHLSH